MLTFIQCNDFVSNTGLLVAWLDFYALLSLKQCFPLGFGSYKLYYYIGSLRSKVRKVKQCPCPPNTPLSSGEFKKNDYKYHDSGVQVNHLTDLNYLQKSVLSHTLMLLYVWCNCTNLLYFLVITFSGICDDHPNLLFSSKI